MVLKAANARKILQHGVGLYFVNLKKKFFTLFSVLYENYLFFEMSTHFSFTAVNKKCGDVSEKRTVFKVANAQKILQHRLYFVNFEKAKFLFYHFLTEIAFFLSCGRLQFYISEVLPITYFSGSKVHGYGR